MTHTPTLPPTDRTMQRKLKALVHPDNRGDHELFIWTANLIEVACSGFQHAREGGQPSPRRYPSTKTDPERVPFPPSADFAALTRRAVALADEVPPPYRSVLLLLRDCVPLAGFEEKQGRGASYRQLAAIGHRAGMTKAQRVRWYRIAESVPLSDRHAGHLLGKLERFAA